MIMPLHNYNVAPSKYCVIFPSHQTSIAQCDSVSVCFFTGPLLYCIYQDTASHTSSVIAMHTCIHIHDVCYLVNFKELTLPLLLSAVLSDI